MIAQDDSSSSSMTSRLGMTSYAVYVPYTTLVRMPVGLGKSISSFAVSARDGNLDAAQDDVSQILLARLDGDEDAFSVLNFNSVMDVMSSVTDTMSVVMGGVATISLLVGGIGIMNIMLVSVSERTREIGIRKAIGAKRRDILMQFLVEAMAISIFGCTIGVALSWATLAVIGALVSTLSFSMNPSVVLVASAFSLAIDLVFGLYPANKAAKMKPIDALHYEG